MPSSPTGTTGPTGTSGTTGPTVNTTLPPPPQGAGHNWQSAYAAYQANPTAGYAAYYNFLAAGKTSAPMLAAGHFPAPGTPGAPTGTTGATGTSGPAGVSGPSNVPLHNNDPNVLGLYNRDPNWLSNFVTPGTAFGATGPAATNPTPTGTTGAGTTGPAGTTGGFGPPGTTVPGGGTPHEGNAGGASHGVGGGGAGDNAGHPGTNAQGLSTNNLTSGGLIGDDDILNLGPLGASALGTGAMLAPGYGGMALGAIQMAMRGVSLAQINAVREQQGLPSLTAGQIAGGLSALNQYANLGGGNTVADSETLANRLGNFDGSFKNTLSSTNGVPAYKLADAVFGGPWQGSSGSSPAETQGGQPYQDGPGGLLGWAARQLGLVDGPTRALDINSVNRLTHPNFDDSAWPGEETDMPTGNGGSSGSSFGASAAQSAAQANRYGGVTNAAGQPYNPKTDAGAGAGGSGSGGSSVGGSDHAGQSMGNTSSASGLGNPGGAGIGGLSGHDTTAVGASGQLGHIRTGGWIGDHAKPVNRLMGGPVPGDPRQGDTVPIRATPDEFMINRDAARAAGPQLLHMMNDPKMAGWLAEEMRKFSPDARGHHPQERPPVGGPQGSKYGDPHLPDAFIDAIMHPQHAARLAALHKSGWAKSWA